LSLTNLPCVFFIIALAMNTSDIKDFLRKHDVDNDVINNIKQGYKKQSLLLLVKNNLKNQGVTSKALQPLSIQELAKLLHLIQQFVAACNTTPTGHVNVGRSAPFTENQQETAEKENNHHLAETAITNPDIAPEITQKNTAHKRKKTETSCGDSVGRRKSSVPNNSSGSSSSSSSDSSSSSSDSSSSSSDSSTSSLSSSSSSSSNSSAWRSSKFPLIVNDCYDHLRQILKNMKPSRKAIIYESFLVSIFIAITTFFKHIFLILSLYYRSISRITMTSTYLVSCSKHRKLKGNLIISMEATQ
jgi:hypothetical protein